MTTWIDVIESWPWEHLCNSIAYKERVCITSRDTWYFRYVEFAKKNVTVIITNNNEITTIHGYNTNYHNNTVRNHLIFEKLDIFPSVWNSSNCKFGALFTDGKIIDNVLIYRRSDDIVYKSKDTLRFVSEDFIKSMIDYEHVRMDFLRNPIDKIDFMTRYG